VCRRSGMHIFGPLETLMFFHDLDTFKTIVCSDRKLAHFICQAGVVGKVVGDCDEVFGVDGVIKHWRCESIEGPANRQA
jgi:hypothetical protein